MPFVDIGLYYLPVNLAPISLWQSTLNVLNLDLNLILPLFFILKMLSAYYLFVCFVALCPKSTAMVMAGQSVHLTTLFPGQA